MQVTDPHLLKKLLIGEGILLGIYFLAYWITRSEWLRDFGIGNWFIWLPLLLAGITNGAGRMVTQINGKGISVKYPQHEYLPRTYQWKDILQAEVVEEGPVADKPNSIYNGKEKVYFTQPGPAIRLRLKTGLTVYISTGQPVEVLTFIRHYETAAHLSPS